MRTSDTLRLALRMFRTRPMRTSLTILGVSVGIATVFFLVCLGYGLQQTILNRIANAETLLTLDVSAGSEAVRLTPERIEELRAIEHVGDIARLASFSAQVSIGSITSDMEINAVDPVFFRLSGISAVAGELFDAADGTGAVLSSAAVKLFGLTPQEILQRAADYTLYLPEEAQDGKISIRESAHATMVAGVVEDEDTSRLLLPLSAVAAIPIEHFHQVKVKVESHAHMESVRNAIMAQGFVVASLSDTIDQATKIFKIVQIVLALFGLVALIVSAIGMFNTMTITLLERTSEIGIMRSIGMTRANIRTLFLVESMVMGFLGGMAGLLLGALAGQAVNVGMNMLARRFHGPPVDLFVTPLWFVIVIITFSTAIGFITGLYPSFRAARLNPLDALRYK